MLTAEVIDKRISYALESFFPAIVARVLRFDPVLQTATVVPVNYELHPDGVTKMFAKIEDVPVVLPSIFGTGLTLPKSVIEGSDCLLVNMSRDHDNYHVSGTYPSQPNTARKLAYNDVSALVGWSTYKRSSKCDTDTLDLKYSLDGDAKITLSLTKDGKISIDNTQNELISVLSEALEIIANNTTATIYGASPMNSKAQILAAKAKLDTFKVG